MIMNQSQNLYADLSYALTKRIDYKLLQKQLNKPNNSVSSRIFTAINWFYKANKDENDNFDAIIKLSIAFEALLNLPKDGKTERFIDTISLLLGRTPRLDNWAKQFYEVRSGIVHEGYTHTDQLRFNVSINKQQRKPYQSLLSYGRQIFQLCVSTLLVGADLAEEAGLEGKFITNQERFEKICELLNQSNTVSQLNNISSLVIAIQQYKYISENELQINTMIGAVKEVAKIVVEQDQDLSNEFKKLLELLINAPNSSDNYEQLEALQKLKDFLPKELFLVYPSYKQIVKDLIEVIWSYVFLHYFWLKKQHNIE